MQHFEFHYQYQPDDLKAIREAGSAPVFSPAGDISAAATGFAIGLLVLGAVGAWFVLCCAVVVGVLTLFVLAHRLNANSRANREYQLRTVQFFDHCIIEKTRNSESVRSWRVIDECIETDSHFLLRYYHRTMAIPKRVIPVPDSESFRVFLNACLQNKESVNRVSEFDAWLSKPGLKIFKFSWHPDDQRAIVKTGLSRVSQKSTSQIRGSPMTGWLGPILLLAGILILSFAFQKKYLLPSDRGNWSQLVQTLLVYLLAFSAPWVSLWGWRKYIKILRLKDKTPMPKEEISLAAVEGNLVVGYPHAVSRYEFDETASWYVGPELIGFQLGFGPVNVLPVRAFGGSDQARIFLQQMIFSNRSSAATHQNSRTETGNPYQPPGA